MRAKQHGFTLVELIVVIVILGILAATAIPKFVDMSVDAGNGAAQGMVGAMNSATSINYAKYNAAGGTTTGAVQLNAATKCSDLSALVTPNIGTGDFSWVSATDTLAACSTAGAVDGTCKIKHAKGSSSGYAISAICTG